MSPHFVSAIFLMFMGTVGSGIFVLPYLFAHSNLIFASIFLVFLTTITAALNQFYVEIIKKTPGDHQLTGYASIYLGPKFKLITTLNLVLLAFGAITAYSKLFTSFLNLLFPSLSLSLASILYLAFLFLSLALSRERVGLGFRILVPIFILVIPVLLFIFSLNSQFVIRNSSFLITSPSFAFFGATLFALSGFTIIPEVEETLGSNKKLSLAVLLGLLLAALIYFLYAFSVIRLSGQSLSINSVSGLASTYPLIAKFIAIFGLVITLRASFNFLIILRELFYRDLKISKTISNSLPFLFPVLALFLRSVSLISIISLTGHLTIFISALIICLIRLRLPHTFATQFFSLLIILSLTFGLVVYTLF